jgi:hypothetical protein
MSDSERGHMSSDDHDAEGAGRSRSWWIKVVAASLVAPALMILPASVMLIVATNSLDVAHALGVSDTTVNGILIAIGGLLAGVTVGLIAGVRRWQLIRPALAAVIVGVAIMLGLVAAGAENSSLPVFVLLGQSAGILIATTMTSYTALASLLVVVVAGIGVGLVLQPAPEPNAELSFVLAENYSVNSTTGECSGSNDFSGIVEGSTASLVGTDEVEALGSLVLSAGVEITQTSETAYLLWNGADTGCLFELGTDELGASAHTGTSLFPTGLGSGAPEQTSAQHVVYLFGEYNF